MRKELKAIGKQERHTFSGVFVREGLKSAYRGLPLPTVLLKDVKLKDSDKIITDHLWFKKKEILFSLMPELIVTQKAIKDIERMFVIILKKIINCPILQK